MISRMWALLKSRWMWVLMVVIHGPALASSVAALALHGLESDRLGGLLALLASMVFFALKIVGVSWLEFATHRRSLVAIAIAIVFLHTGAIGSYVDPAWVPTGVPVAATGLLAAGLSSVQRTAGILVASGRCAARRRNERDPAIGLIWAGLLTPSKHLFVACHCAPRAPPA